MISARDKRTLIFGVAVIGTLFGSARGVPAVLEWERQRVAEAAELSAQASSARVKLQLLPVLRDSLAAREARMAVVDSSLLSGATASAAAAELARVLDELALDSKVKVNAMQLRGDSAAVGALSHVAVRVTGVADVVGLAAFLRAVEGDETPLVVRELAVTQPEPAAAENKVESLRIDVLVESVARIASVKR